MNFHEFPMFVGKVPIFRGEIPQRKTQVRNARGNRAPALRRRRRSAEPG